MSTASDTEKKALDTVSPLKAVSTAPIAGANGSSVRSASSQNSSLAALNTSAQTQIEDSKLFSALFDKLGEAVLISDHTGRIIRANRAATAILGMSLEKLTELHHDDQV